ncbi:hypothetical protein RhiLY_06453 [Ceratobasidium sp. AG-Ba]|nr:hypothetical protein RhiLY_06453 [Ceratobasidium sp. AG-Ba]
MVVPLPLSPPSSLLLDVDIPPPSLPHSGLSTTPLEVPVSEVGEEQYIPSSAIATAPDLVTPPSTPFLVDVPSRSLVETIQVDNKQIAEPPKYSTASIRPLFAPSPEQTGVAFLIVGKSRQDDGGYWTVVESKCKPQRAPESVLKATSTSGSKTKRGRRAEKKPERGN